MEVVIVAAVIIVVDMYNELFVLGVVSYIYTLPFH